MKRRRQRRERSLSATLVGFAWMVSLLTGCSSMPSTTHVQPVDLQSCMVRQCMGPELECRRESRNQIYTAKNWRCLAGN